MPRCQHYKRDRRQYCLSCAFIAERERSGRPLARMYVRVRGRDYCVTPERLRSG